MIQFVQAFPDEKIVSTLSTQLGWSHFIEILPLKSPLARQKRMSVGKDDFYLDLLFYHRYLRRLVAIELKLESFKPAHTGQMELYLRWLDKHDRATGEESPIGLILCASADAEQVELLQLDENTSSILRPLAFIATRSTLFLASVCHFITFVTTVVWRSGFAAAALVGVTAVFPLASKFA